MPKYINNSSKSRIKSIKVFDLLTNNETQYESLAEFGRSFKATDRDLATLSYCLKNGRIFKNQYIGRYIGEDYFISDKCKQVYNSVTNKIYSTLKEAQECTGINKNDLINFCNRDEEWHWIYSSAREKLRESGKPLKKETLIQAI